MFLPSSPIDEPGAAADGRHHIGLFAVHSSRTRRPQLMLALGGSGGVEVTIYDVCYLANS